MGGDLDEPPAKRIKQSTPELEQSSSNAPPPHHTNPSDAPMSKPLPPQAQINGDTVGSDGIIKRVEFVRVITESLYRLGYKNAGAILEKESGIQLHSDLVKLLREQVLGGNWDGSVATLHKLSILDNNVVKSASFLILEQRFLELLKSGKVADALVVLKGEITPLGINTKRVHELCVCVIGFGKIGRKFSSSPRKVLEELQKLLPQGLMVAEKRLEHLIELALSLQKEVCFFHNSLDSSLSLYADHCCGRNKIPSHTTQVLQGHTDEVWFVQFSKSGRYLASSSSDKSAIIWEANEDGKLSLKHKLCGHTKPVLMVAWNHDDTQLLTCGLEEDVRRWDVQSGQCLGRCQRPGFGIISCGFVPDGTKFFMCLTDKNFCFASLDGKDESSFKGERNTKISDMAVMKKNERIVISMYKESTIQLYDFTSKVRRFIEEDDTITSFSLSNNDDFLLVDLVNQVIHLWSIDDEPELIMAYGGHKRTRLLIRSCFGGFKQTFVASGSEDSRVYIWHRDRGTFLKALEGHSGTVNCVSWNPTNHHMLASASDDRTIRIWGLKDGNTSP